MICGSVFRAWLGAGGRQRAGGGDSKERKMKRKAPMRGWGPWVNGSSSGLAVTLAVSQGSPTEGRAGGVLGFRLVVAPY